MPTIDRLPHWQIAELVHTLAAHYDLDTIRQIAEVVTAAADRPVPRELHAEHVRHEVTDITVMLRNAFHAHPDWTLNEGTLPRSA